VHLLAADAGSPVLADLPIASIDDLSARRSLIANEIGVQSRVRKATL
jgi:hypothetical protein